MCLAIPGKIVSISSTGVDSFRTGKVSFGGITRDVNLSMVPEADVEDYVLVHVGVAINRIDENEAMLTFKYLQQIGELNELEES